MLRYKSFFQGFVRVVSGLLLIAGLSLLQAQESSLSMMANDATLEWGPCPAFIGKGCEIAVLQGDPAKDNSDIFFKVPADFKIPMHWHSSAERMVLVAGKMDVQYEGEKTRTLQTNAYAYGPPKKPHRAYCHKGGECILFIAFEKPVDAFEVKDKACLEKGI